MDTSTKNDVTVSRKMTPLKSSDETEKENIVVKTIVEHGIF